MTNFTWPWFSPLAFDRLHLFSSPLQTWWSGFLSLPTRSQISSIIWMTSLLRALPSLLRCTQNLATVLEVCQWLGLPLHPGKCMGPSTVLFVLGINLDSVNQVTCLPRRSSYCYKPSLVLGSLKMVQKMQA